MHKLTPLEQQMLWAEDGPYSEAKIVLNTRILDDAVSRTMVEVQGHINPTTFRLVKRHRTLFADDVHVQNILKFADYWGKKEGFVVSLGDEEYSNDPLVMQRASEKLRVLKQAIIRMHEFVLDYLESAD